MPWQTTKHGGLRRTRVTQKMGTSALESSEKPEAIASAKGYAFDTPSSTSEEYPPNTRKVGGSNPSPRTIIRMNEKLGIEGCEYLVRWRIETKWGSVRLHHWLGPDDDRAHHDHPWDFVTFVLKGGYTDDSPAGRQHLKAPQVQHRSALHRHTVFPDPGGAWTLVFTGPKIRPWGFWVKDKFVKANKYFLSHGHHPCN